MVLMHISPGLIKWGQGAYWIFDAGPILSADNDNGHDNARILDFS